MITCKRYRNGDLTRSRHIKTTFETGLHTQHRLTSVCLHNIFRTIYSSASLSGRLFFERMLHVDEAWKKWLTPRNARASRRLVDMLCMPSEIFHMLISIVCLMKKTSRAMMQFSLVDSAFNILCWKCDIVGVSLTFCCEIAHIWWDCYCETHF